MSAMTARERSLRGKLAAYESWARTPNRTARTAAARAALDRTFIDMVPPEITDPVARARAAESLRKAHYARLGLKSAKSRRRKAKRQTADAEHAQDR
jgi:hypothetical protein